METRRNRSNNTRRGRRGRRGGNLPKYSSTFHSINKCHMRLFEKLGWVVLAKAKGYQDIVDQYKRNIDHFLKTVQHVGEEYENHNRVHDLNVVYMNVEELKEFVDENL